MCFSVAEDALKARREIADYIKNKRTERARIRVCIHHSSYLVLIWHIIGTVDHHMILFILNYQHHVTQLYCIIILHLLEPVNMFIL